MCQDLPDCAYWMYTKPPKKGTGMCKLWAVDQDPCKSTSSFLFPLSTVRFTFRGKGARDSLVGGPCRLEVESDFKFFDEDKERKLLDKSSGDIDFEKLNTEECPHLDCPAPIRGFVFDHKDKGHLKAVKLQGDMHRGYSCYNLCRDTPNCSVYMVDETSAEGECKLWTKEQSPCEPTDPYDASTAHFVRQIPGREFWVGGNCHKLKPRPPQKSPGHT